MPQTPQKQKDRKKRERETKREEREKERKTERETERKETGRRERARVPFATDSAETKQKQHQFFFCDDA